MTGSDAHSGCRDQCNPMTITPSLSIENRSKSNVTFSHDPRLWRSSRVLDINAREYHIHIYKFCLLSLKGMYISFNLSTNTPWNRTPLHHPCGRQPSMPSWNHFLGVPHTDASTAASSFTREALSRSFCHATEQVITTEGRLRPHTCTTKRPTGSPTCQKEDLTRLGAGQ